MNKIFFILILVLNFKENFSMTSVSSDVMNEVLCTGSLETIAKNINFLAKSNKQISHYINNPTTNAYLIKEISKKFEIPELFISHFLGTREAKKYFNDHVKEEAFDNHFEHILELFLQSRISEIFIKSILAIGYRYLKKTPNRVHMGNDVLYSSYGYCLGRSYDYGGRNDYFTSPVTGKTFLGKFMPHDYIGNSERFVSLKIVNDNKILAVSPVVSSKSRKIELGIMLFNDNGYADARFGSSGITIISVPQITTYDVTNIFPYIYQRHNNDILIYMTDGIVTDLDNGQRHASILKKNSNPSYTHSTFSFIVRINSLGKPENIIIS